LNSIRCISRIYISHALPVKSLNSMIFIEFNEVP
jgi:hypothetical protein